MYAVGDPVNLAPETELIRCLPYTHIFAGLAWRMGLRKILAAKVYMCVA